MNLKIHQPPISVSICKIYSPETCIKKSINHKDMCDVCFTIVNMRGRSFKDKLDLAMERSKHFPLDLCLNHPEIFEDPTKKTHVNLSE